MTNIDFTKQRLSDKNHIIVCPNCGKHGELHKYTNGDAGISHKGKVINAAGLFTCFEVTDHCYIKNYQEAV